MTPDKRRTTPLVQLLATGWSHAHAHGGKPLNLVPCRWRMTDRHSPVTHSDPRTNANRRYGRRRTSSGPPAFERLNWHYEPYRAARQSRTLGGNTGMSDQVYTLGVWRVKNGKEDEFAAVCDWSSSCCVPATSLPRAPQSARRPGEAR
jgi:hypothetical protein